MPLVLLLPGVLFRVTPSDRGRLRTTPVAVLLGLERSSDGLVTGPVLLLLRAFAWWPAVRVDPVLWSSHLPGPQSR
jgi:hypothetical protein